MSLLIENYLFIIFILTQHFNILKYLGIKNKIVNVIYRIKIYNKFLFCLKFFEYLNFSFEIYFGSLF